MKKLTAILVCVILCFSMFACGGSNAEGDILGEWKSLDGTSLTFHKDGMGTNQDGESFTWKYDEELQCYTVAIAFNMSFNIVTEGDLTYFDILGGMMRFYRAEDYDAAYAMKRQEAIDEINSYTEGRTKIELGQSYPFTDGVSAAFLGAVIVDYSNDHVCLEAAFTADDSVGTASIYDSRYLIEYTTYYLYNGVETGWVSSTGIQWGANLGEHAGAKSFEPGQTVTARGSVYNAHSTPLDSIEQMICCFTMNGTEYYMDLSAYIK